MDWVKAHYDRVSVIAAAVFLALCSFLIWRSASAFSDSFVAAQTSPQPKRPAPPGKAADVDAALQRLQQPPQWTFSGRSGLFVPEKHFIGTNGMPATLQNTQVHPPVPNEWLEQFNLPIADASRRQSRKPAHPVEPTRAINAFAPCGARTLPSLMK